MSDLSNTNLPPEVAEALAAADQARPEEVHLSPREWMKENLFSSPFNTALTVLFSLMALAAIRGLLGFIFAPDARWDATATNLRLLMTGNYPSDQYTRVWVSLGIIVSLAAMSAAAWNAASRVPLPVLGRKITMLGAAVALIGVLAPFSASARLAYLGVAAALIAVGLLVTTTIDKSVTVSSLVVVISAIGLAIASLWVVPYGHHAFVDGVVITESGTVASSTKLPWSVMVLLAVVAYQAGRALTGVLGARLRTIIGLCWVASPVVIVFFVLRDPNFDYGHIASVELPLFIAHAVIGGVILYLLAKPGVGEIGRIAAALLLLASLATFLTPMQQVFRITAIALALFALAAPSFAGATGVRLRYVSVWITTVGLTIWLVTAINAPSTVGVRGFFTGGLALTLIVVSFTLLLSFPLGVMLALARTSKMPIFRIMATTYIEFVRGIPLITVLFFFSVMLPLFLPDGMSITELAAAIVAYVLFSAAYLAENVRGGLQSIRRGQFEAADALGMTGMQRTIFIVLPQALRVSIPPLVGQAIATYKETSLLAIVGIFDLLYIGRNIISAQIDFLGSAQEQLLFTALIYWVGAFSMSRASQRLERKLGLGERCTRPAQIPSQPDLQTR